MNRWVTSISSAALLVLLLLPMLASVAPVAAETIATDKALYAIKWNNTAYGYVNVTVTVSGLDPTKHYEVSVFKWLGPAGLNYVKEVYGASFAELHFTLPPTMDARPIDIAGTWNATLYREGERIGYVNFGIWAINARKINFGRILQVWGGGMNSTDTVEFRVYNATTYITDILFGEDPANCTVDSVKYTFSNSSFIITPPEISKDTYTVELTGFTLLDTVTPGAPVETILTFEVTDQLLVTILSPEDGSGWRRTETVPVEVEVLYQDYVPVTSGEVKVTFTSPLASESVSLSYYPPTTTWKGSFKIEKDNATGTWPVLAEAWDNYNNYGSDTVSIDVDLAILVVTTEVDPAATVSRASWVEWIVKVTYKGDGALAKLDLPRCTVYVVNATTGEIVGSGYLVEIEVGRYNVTWFVPPDATLGEYKFYIPANGLYDNITVPAGANRGPEEDTYSTPFLVGKVAIKVEVKTYEVKFDTETEKISFTPGSMVYIGAKCTYIDSGVTVSSGTVTAYIYNETGYLVAEVPMNFHSATRMWWGEWDSDDYPTGRYTVVVKAKDIGYNVGEGQTYFYLSGLVISPSEGTVPPSENTVTEETDEAGVWNVYASIYVDPATGKTLGTTVTVSGSHFTPDSEVNVTVEWLPYLQTAAKILLAANIPTDGEGDFSVSFVFPTAINGTYVITAADAEGISMEGEFTVIPGIILTPDPVVGSALIKVVGTGFPADATAVDLLVDGTDAMSDLAAQALSWRWVSDVNGTLDSTSLNGYSVSPGFIMPFIEPGTYEFEVITQGGYSWLGSYKSAGEAVASASDTVTVENAFKEFNLVVDKLDQLTEMVNSVNMLLTSVDANVATLVSDVGVVKTDVSNLKSMIEEMGGTITDISGGIATISTAVGDLKASIDALAPKIEEVRGDIAALSTAIGDIPAKIEALKPTITEIKDGVATIQTTLGELKGTISTIDGNVATVRTDVGDIKATVTGLSGVPSAVSNVTIAVWIAVILSLIAAICSIISLVQLRRRIAG